jgi:hypothetical protein
MRLFLLLMLSLLASCSGGAVVFAPTPAPADSSPLRYDHPSGAFSVVVPRLWPVFTQNATTLAAASFSPPDSPLPLVSFAVIKLDQALDNAGFGALIDQYQTSIRPDAARYKEENRQAMGDGSWRMTGLRRMAGGDTEQVNTFIERSDHLLAVIEVIVPAADSQHQETLQDVVNSFQMQADNALEATDPSVLVSLAASSLELVNIGTWTTPEGVLYITGEVANYSPLPLVDLPLRALLRLESGQVVAEAVDTTMGYGVLPGGFAPFSLRFGQGIPAQNSSYELILGAADWDTAADTVIYGPGSLAWIDESGFDENGHLLISGTVTNIGTEIVRNPKATATIFDANQRVIGARFVDLEASLQPNESIEFRIPLPELGGSPAQYIVSVQALP